MLVGFCYCCECLLWGCLWLFFHLECRWWQRQRWLWFIIRHVNLNIFDILLIRFSNPNGDDLKRILVNKWFCRYAHNSVTLFSFDCDYLSLKCSLSNSVHQCFMQHTLLYCIMRCTSSSIVRSKSKFISNDELPSVGLSMFSSSQALREIPFIRGSVSKAFNHFLLFLSNRLIVCSLRALFHLSIFNTNEWYECAIVCSKAFNIAIGHFIN